MSTNVLPIHKGSYPEGEQYTTGRKKSEAGKVIRTLSLNVKLKKACIDAWKKRK
jgi:hypothetical protein